MDELDEIREEYKRQAWKDQFQVGQYVRSWDVPRYALFAVEKEGQDPKKVLPYIEGWIRKIGPFEECLYDGRCDHLHIEVLIDSWPTVDSESLLEIPARDWVFPALDHTRHRCNVEVLE